MILEFTIKGNQENPYGNAIPKAKLTSGQQWTKKAQRYVAWKQYVQEAFQPILIAAAIDMPTIDPLKILKSPGRYLKPVTMSEEMSMGLRIYWADETHPDPESVFGSIADSLFVDDKHLNVEYVHTEHCPEKKGRVEVKLTIPDVRR